LASVVRHVFSYEAMSVARMPMVIEKPRMCQRAALPRKSQQRACARL
jgi:hypothetical protein